MPKILTIAQNLLSKDDFEAFSGELWLRMARIEEKIEAGAPIEGVIAAEFKRYSLKERNVANRSQNRSHRRVRVSEKIDFMDPGRIVRRW